jgi:hypothetical protein
MFDIDFNKIITWLSPVLRRQATYFSWLQVLCAGVVSLYNTFMVERTADLYTVNHDSRVFSMQAVFNDLFDMELRRIYISDGFNKNRIYIYTREEAQPVPLYTRAEDEPVYIWNRGDYGDTGVDFIVWVPAVLNVVSNSGALAQLTAQINEYKLASKRYAIYTF